LVGVATVVVVSSAPLVPSPGTSTLALVGVLMVVAVVVLVDVAAAWRVARVVLVCRVVVGVGRVDEVVTGADVELDEVLVSSVGTDS
jgi:hypothetical protein